MKKWGHLSCFHASFLTYGPSVVQTKVHIFQFCANLSQKLKSVKAIYMYGSESSYYSLSENDMVYRGSEPPFMIY